MMAAVSVETMLAALVSLVKADTTIKALIGLRFYPLVVPVNMALPAAAYQVITTPRDYLQDGQSTFTGPRVQITVSADSYDEARTVAEAFRSLLSGYRGTSGGVVFHGIFLENEYDGYSFETEIKTVRQDYRINFREG